MFEELCMALITSGTLATPMPVTIDTHYIIEGVRESVHAVLITAEQKNNIHHIMCPQDYIIVTKEDLTNAIASKY